MYGLSTITPHNYMFKIINSSINILASDTSMYKYESGLDKICQYNKLANTSRIDRNLRYNGSKLHQVLQVLNCKYNITMLKII